MLPPPILALLMLIALLSGLVARYAMAARGRRGLLHAIWCAAAIALTVYVVLDLDDPRAGLIRLQPTEKILQQLQDSIR